MEAAPTVVGARVGEAPPDVAADSRPHSSAAIVGDNTGKESDQEIAGLAFLSLLLSGVLVWKGKPHLYDEGIACPRHALAEAADWVLVADLAFYTTALGLRCANTSPRASRLLTSCVRAALAFGLLAATSKALVLSVVHGFSCGLVETHWYFPFALFLLVSSFPTLSPSQRSAARRESAETAVTKVMRGLCVHEWQEQVVEDGTRSRGEAQCCICLSDWEARDRVVVTPCGHNFHESCLKEWLVQQVFRGAKQLCAVCRRDLEFSERGVVHRDPSESQGS